MVGEDWRLGLISAHGRPCSEKKAVRRKREGVTDSKAAWPGRANSETVGEPIIWGSQEELVGGHSQHDAVTDLTSAGKTVQGRELSEVIPEIQSLDVYRELGLDIPALYTQQGVNVGVELRAVA